MLESSVPWDIIEAMQISRPSAITTLHVIKMKKIISSQQLVCLGKRYSLIAKLHRLIGNAAGFGHTPSRAKSTLVRFVLHLALKLHLEFSAVFKQDFLNCHLVFQAGKWASPETE